MMPALQISTSIGRFSASTALLQATTESRSLSSHATGVIFDSVTHPLQAGGQISQICLQVLLVHRLADAVDSQGLFAFQSPKAIPQVVDVRDVVIQRSKHQDRVCPCSTSYPCQVCAHRNFTPCIVPVFLPSRASECGNLHSTGISRFNAKPVPVPLRSRRLRAFFYVGPAYSDDTAPKNFSARQDCSIIVIRLDAV